MNTPVEQEVYIRLTDAHTGFVCTIKHGLYSKEIEYPLAQDTAAEEERSLMFLRKRSSRRHD
jgi:hypothetical protein